MKEFELEQHFINLICYSFNSIQLPFIFVQCFSQYTSFKAALQKMQSPQFRVICY